jgi:hypothetical protein
MTLKLKKKNQCFNGGLFVSVYRRIVRVVIGEDILKKRNCYLLTEKIYY